MITIYHLSTSRSQRIIWLMEELGESYELKRFQRENGRSPAAFREVHQLGKSPTISDGALTIVESGAIIEYILEKYGKGRLVPDKSSADFGRYLQWLHFAEGTFMSALIQTLRASGALGGGQSSDLEAIKAGSDRCLAFAESELKDRPYFAGAEFTAADIMMTYAIALAERFGGIDAYPNLKTYQARVAARPAYKKAMEIANPPVAAA